MAKKKKVSGTRLAMFAVGMVIGLGLIIFDQFETIEGIISGTEPTGLAILEVPIDPSTGGILGTIKLGAPDVVPFEQSGTHISTDQSFGCSVDFGRRLSGERNLDPVWWQPRPTGFSAFNCGFAYAQWDVTDIPNDFVATSVQFQLELVESANQVVGQNCLITFNDFNIDTVPEATLIAKLRTEPQVILEGRPSSFPNTADFVQDPNGTWCRTTGVKTFNFAQTGVDIVNNAIAGGTFDQGVRNDKLVLGFVPSDFGGRNNAGEQYRISNQFWATQGSWIITGSSPPIRCDAGFMQVEFRCVPIICSATQTLNLISNQCEEIQCQFDEIITLIVEDVACIQVCIDDPLTVNIIECGSACPPSGTIERAVCVPDNPPVTDPIPPLDPCPIGEILIGETCQSLQFQCDVILSCQEGTRPDANNCGCELIECTIGQELIGDQCQAIQCAPNLILSGNNCIEKSCPANQFLVDNICQDTNPDPDFTCDVGFNKIGNLCYPIQEELVCPEGTEKFENVCVQFLPDLMISQAPELGTLSIVGIVIFGGSFFGLVGSRRV